MPAHAGLHLPFGSHRSHFKVGFRSHESGGLGWNHATNDTSFPQDRILPQRQQSLNKNVKKVDFSLDSFQSAWNRATTYRQIVASDADQQHTQTRPGPEPTLSVRHTLSASNPQVPQQKHKATLPPDLEPPDQHPTWPEQQPAKAARPMLSNAPLLPQRWFTSRQNIQYDY